MIPYPETMMEPHRSNFLALGAVVGRGKIAGPEKWPEWDRLVDKYGWKLVLKAADRCEPEKRWSSNIESICQSLAHDALQSSKEADMRERGKVRKGPVDREGASALFSEILKQKGLRQ